MWATCVNYDRYEIKEAPRFSIDSGSIKVKAKVKLEAPVGSQRKFLKID